MIKLLSEVKFTETKLEGIGVQDPALVLVPLEHFQFASTLQVEEQPSPLL